jgi:tetratricopeptide (TPR) repeat protein
LKFLKKLFGNKNKALHEKIYQDKYLKEKIHFYDKSGKELYTTKSEWLQKILLPALKSNYSDPDELYNLVVGALQDGFEEFLLDASSVLYKNDKNRERAGCVYAIVLMKNEKLLQAKEILEETISEIGKTGVLLTNLAKVYADLNDDNMVEKILWEALELDPNQDNGMVWYLAIHREKEGKEGYIKALNKISHIDNAWRALVYLADISIENDNIADAMSYYQRAIKMENNLPSDILKQVSGNLGTNNYIDELITVIEPLFNSKVHSFHEVGNNLIKAYIDSGRYEKAERTINDYIEQNNPTIKKDLQFWQNELEKKYNKT